MKILVINGGSSSIKFSIFESRRGDATEDPAALVDGELSGIGSGKGKLEIKRGESGDAEVSDAGAESIADAIRLVFDKACGDRAQVDAVGYRVVHPGARLKGHQRITPQVIEDLEQAAAFAPLHDPEAVEIIREGMKKLPGVPHFACFDTVFHATMPEEATVYPLPEEYARRGVRRYGFHGLSCESIVRQMTADGAQMPRRMIIAHLGSGCSVTAVLDGRSIDTTMGLTPTGGVLMGTRPGDLDPGLVIYLARQQQGDARAVIAAVETMLNHASGTAALSGMANDVKALRGAAAGGNVRAALALKVFTRSVAKAVGGFTWLMGGVDAIVFAGGIGEHDAATREEVLGQSEPGGLIDSSLNRSLNRASGSGMRTISGAQSKVKVLVVPAREDLMIAIHVAEMSELDGDTRH